MSGRYTEIAKEQAARFRTADMASDADDILSGGLNRLGYARFIYGWSVGNFTTRISREISFRGTLSMSVMERYTKSNRPYVDQDFYAWQCGRQADMIPWGDPAILAAMNPAEQACDYWLVEAAGLRVGHSLPLRGIGDAGIGGIGICADPSITADMIGDHWRHVGGGVTMLVRAYHEELHRRLLRVEAALTPMEKAVLEHQLSGYGTKEIAEILGRSEKTIYGYLNAAAQKLDARTSEQALIKAYYIRAIGDRSNSAI